MFARCERRHSSLTGPIFTLTATQTDCDAPTGTATVVGAGNAQILWSTGATTASISGLFAGWYKVSVTDNIGCQKIDSVEVTKAGLPKTILIQEKFCVAKQYRIAAFKGAESIEWMPDSSSQIVAGANTDTVTVVSSTAALHRILLTYTMPNDACPRKTFFGATVEICAATDAPELLAASLSPNPFSKNLTLNFGANPPNDCRAELLDLLGQKVLEQKIAVQETVFATEGFPVGIYFLKVKFGQNERVFRVLKTD